MFNSKYSKLLTAILVIAIIAIIGLLTYIAIDWYKAYTTNTDITDGLDQFDGYINNVISNTETNTVDNTIIDPNIDENVVVENTTGNTTGDTTTSAPTYKGFNMVGKIEIPKTNVEYPVLEEVTPNSIEASVAVLYGPGINQIGNTVIIGHNFRNGTFFSNNNRLSIGDEIYLTDLEGTRIKYTIYKKYITGTDDFDYAVRDTNGKREVTLSTCTDDGSERIIIWAEEN